MLCRKKLVVVLTLTCLVLLLVTANHYIGNDEGGSENKVNSEPELTENPQDEVMNAVKNNKQGLISASAKLISSKSGSHVQFKKSNTNSIVQQAHIPRKIGKNMNVQ